MNVKQITNSIWNLSGKARLGMSHNMYVIKDEKITLIDPAFLSISKFKKALTQINLTIEDFDLLLSTHWHVDHSSKACLLKKMSNATYMIHEKEKLIIESFSNMAKELGKFKDDEEFFNIWKGFIKLWNYEHCKVTSTFKDGDIINLGRSKLKVLYTPGHTDGHCCFELLGEKQRILFAGDMSPKEYLWNGYATSSFTDYLNSLERLQQEDWDIILSGHFQLYKQEVDIKTMYQKVISILNERDEKILKLVKEGHSTVEEIVQFFPTIRPNGDKWDQFSEYHHVLKHLQRLESLGKIKQKEIEGKVTWK
ncbi:MAG: MBL fold metallo-hydrolase [Candidatus Lokiarchaeota archaeon]|nr:MBL fold metallo-hydrolase [Candidatus Lokiarchaeota archaeon]